MKTKYMNSYIAGFLMGLILLGTIYVTGRGLGASGAVKSAVIATVKTVTPEHFEQTQYYQNYNNSHNGENPLKSWLVFEIVGVIIGAFLSGLLSNRIKFKLDKGPGVTNTVRIIAAIIGGSLFGIGSQIGRGCTSGVALSGMAVMSFGGIITLIAIFGSGYLVAFFFKKLWIKG